MSEWEKSLYKTLSYPVKVLWLAVTGLLVGVFFGIVASVLYGAGPAAFVGKYGSIAAVWKVYLAGGVFGGLVGGLLLPLVRSRLGASITGVLGVLPLYAAAGVFLSGPLSQWEGWDYGIVIVASLVTGISIGLKGWAEYGEG